MVSGGQGDVMCVCVGHVADHQDAQQACVVIPFEVDSAVEAICSVLGDLIFNLEGCYDLVRILLLGVFYSKVIDN